MTAKPDAGEDVLSRLRKLQRRMESGEHYGFQQDIWQAAADEIERLRADLAMAHDQIRSLQRKVPPSAPQPIRTHVREG